MNRREFWAALISLFAIKPLGKPARRFKKIFHVTNQDGPINSITWFTSGIEPIMYRDGIDPGMLEIIRRYKPIQYKSLGQIAAQ